MCHLIVCTWHPKKATNLDVFQVFHAFQTAFRGMTVTDQDEETLATILPRKTCATYEKGVYCGNLMALMSISTDFETQPV